MAGKAKRQRPVNLRVGLKHNKVTKSIRLNSNCAANGTDGSGSAEALGL